MCPALPCGVPAGFLIPGQTTALGHTGEGEKEPWCSWEQISQDEPPRAAASRHLGRCHQESHRAKPHAEPTRAPSSFPLSPRAPGCPPSIPARGGEPCCMPGNRAGVCGPRPGAVIDTLLNPPCFSCSPFLQPRCPCGLLPAWPCPEPQQLQLHHTTPNRPFPCPPVWCIFLLLSPLPNASRCCFELAETGSTRPRWSQESGVPGKWDPSRPHCLL